MFNLYALVLSVDKKKKWDSLQSYLSLHSPENIIIAGDLNVTLAIEEKRVAPRLGTQLENGLKTLCWAGIWRISSPLLGNTLGPTKG